MAIKPIKQTSKYRCGVSTETFTLCNTALQNMPPPQQDTDSASEATPQLQEPALAHPVLLCHYREISTKHGTSLHQCVG